jgi:hypothetical protein
MARLAGQRKITRNNATAAMGNSDNPARISVCESKTILLCGLKMIGANLVCQALGINFQRISRRDETRRIARQFLWFIGDFRGVSQPACKAETW